MTTMQLGVRQLLDPAVLVDPYPFYARLRQEKPIFWDDTIDSWVLTRYRDCVAVLRDPGLFCSDWRRIGEQVPTPLLSIQSLDPPQHTEIRHLLRKWLLAGAVTDLGEGIAADIEDLLAGLAEKDECDFVTEFAEPLPLRTVTRLLGVAPPDHDWFLALSHAVADAMDAGLRPETYQPGLTARAELAALVAGWLRAPAPGGVLAAIARETRASGIDPDILANTVRAVLHAGFESSSRFLGLALLALLRTPGAVAELARGDGRVAADELVRYAGAVHADSRGCVRDTALGGQRIARGQVVTLLLGAANRDPDAFPDPDVLRLARTPNHHLGFGRGAHACLGAVVALHLAQTVFTTISRRFPRVCLAGEPTYRRNATLRGLAGLPVRLGGRSAATTAVRR